jgi:Acetyl-CoA dehydrogenase C-terminal like
VATGDAASTLKRIADSLQAQSREAELAVAHLATAREEATEAPYKVADDMLHAMGHALLCWAWARIAIAAMKQAPSEVQEDRLQVCAFGVDWVLPAAQWRWRRVANWRARLPWILG